ncbi:MAG: SseB family protein [Lachnospiraceae bacterium]|jgi:hypothetical protein|nr:SseB family protein [Lachnospiraceae bacterium]NBJ81973.1 SseB family protein [bacterium 1XD42-76]NBK04540.1 SseB family protein [bacterium 1XD42-94]
MSEENSRGTVPSKKEIIKKLRTASELYALMSPCTKMPYVQCDPETMDDEIFLYPEEETAKDAAMRLSGKRIPVQAVRVDQKQLLGFCANLWMMGVNCVLFGEGTPEETRIQLEELVMRPGTGKLPEGQIWVENPELHLTALYFMQEARRERLPQMTDEMKQLQEEILVDFGKGTYLTVYHTDNGIPLIRQQSGDTYQPIFTDMMEMRKFNRDGGFKVVVVEAAKIPGILAREAKGVAVNPAGVNLLLPIERKRAPEESRPSEGGSVGPVNV